MDSLGVQLSGWEANPPADSAHFRVAKCCEGEDGSTRQSRASVKTVKSEGEDIFLCTESLVIFHHAEIYLDAGEKKNPPPTSTLTHTTKTRQPEMR